jgi:hypothetical protein
VVQTRVINSRFTCPQLRPPNSLSLSAHSAPVRAALPSSFLCCRCIATPNTEAKCSGSPSPGVLPWPSLPLARRAEALLVPVANKRAGAAQEHCSLAADYRSAVQCRSVPSSPLSLLSLVWRC